MPNIGPLEVAIVAIIALVIFGPKRLPELGSSMGRGIREFRATISGKDKDDEKDDEKPELTAAANTSAERVEGEVVHEPSA
jgi:sec-independent protein translocase protein TatA